jgi:septum formation protein
MSSKKSQFILASASPRRKELLSGSGYVFEVIPADIHEAPGINELPRDYVARNAREKAHHIAQRVIAAAQGGETTSSQHGASSDLIVIGADTIVVLGDEILEKPKDREHAMQMLSQLSGRTHIVYTAYAIYHNHEKLCARVCETKVTFRTLLACEIEQYVNSGEPMDKAGSYGIQGQAAGFVERIEGSYTNVMGLPLSQLIEDLRSILV